MEHQPIAVALLLVGGAGYRPSDGGLDQDFVLPLAGAAAAVLLLVTVLTARAGRAGEGRRSKLAAASTVADAVVVLGVVALAGLPPRSFALVLLMLPFLEAARQVRHELGRENVFYLHVSLIPYLAPSGELKTKPTQHSVAALRNIGIQPDALVCRADRPIPESMKRKISLMCDVDIEAVIATALEAELVSSDRWAQASKPVIVYCVSRKPNGTMMNQKPAVASSPPK